MKTCIRSTPSLVLHVWQEQRENVTVVHLSGRISEGEGSDFLRDYLRENQAKGYNKILLDMKEVTHIASAGIGQLVAGFTAFTRVGGQLKLLNVSGEVNERLRKTHLYKVFEIFDDEPAAVRSFR